MDKFPTKQSHKNNYSEYEKTFRNSQVQKDIQIF